MPFVAVAAVSALASGFAVTAAGSIAFSLTFSQFLIRTAVALVLGFASSALSPKPKTGASNFGREAQGLTQTVRQPTAAHKLIFGETRAGGVLNYIGMTEDNKFLHMVITFAPHEITAFDEVWINDNVIPVDWLDADGMVTQGTYADIIRIRKGLGTAGQTADAVMVSQVPGWTNDHRGRGCAYLYLRLEYDQDKFPGGVPNITAFLRGMKIFDVRDAATRFTTNSTAFQYWYLSNQEYGPDAANDIDSDLVASSLNVSDEIVDTTETPFIATAASSATDIITLSGTVLELQRGDRVEVSSTGALPLGLTAATDYYWIPYQWKDTPRGKLAATLLDAMEGNAVNFTSGLIRSNLILYSEQIDNAAWIKTSVTVTANATAAPDALTTAENLSDASAVVTGTVTQAVTITDGSELVTASIYFKKNTSNYLEVELKLSGGDDVLTEVTKNIFVDLTNKLISGGANDGQGISDVGGGWMRCYVQALNNSSGNVTATLKISPATNAAALAVANTGAVYAWGAQVEQWPVMSAYQATTDAAASVTSDLTVTRTGEPRYHGSGILNTENIIKENINDLMSGTGGRAIYTGGKWLLKPAAYETPTVTLGEDDIIDAVSIRTKLPTRDRFNAVKGIYRSPFNLENPSDYPVLASTSFAAIDGGQEFREMDFPFSQRPQTCRRVAKVELFKARQGIVVQTTFNLRALQCRCGDNIMLNLPRYGFSNKHFEITGWTLVPKTDRRGNPVLGVQMTLRETAPEIFDWTISEEQTTDPAPNTTLPNAFLVDAPVGLRFDSFPVATLDGDVIFRIVLSWQLHNDTFVTRGGLLEIQYKLDSETEWKPSFFVAGDLTQSEIVQGSLNVEYDIRIRAVNNIGVRSPWNNILGVIAGSSGGVTESRDYGAYVGDVVGTSIDYGAFVGDAVGSTEDWGQFIL